VGAADPRIGRKPKAYDPCLAAGVRDTVVFLGTRRIPQGQSEPRLQFFATGFLIEIDQMTYLFTAEHVVRDFLATRKVSEPFLAAANLKSGTMVVQSLDELPKRFGAGWILDTERDVAATPFPTGSDYRIRTLPLEFFADDEQLAELQDVFFVSFQPGLEAPNRIRPIVRRGMVAVAERGELHLDAFVFPGNSGSPVFVRAATSSTGPTGITLGITPLSCKFVGLVKSYLPYREVAISEQTMRPRVVFEENSGLAQVVTADQLKAFMKSGDFQGQHARLLKTERLR
jgi:hypothetical protein